MVERLVVLKVALKAVKSAVYLVETRVVTWVAWMADKLVAV